MTIPESVAAEILRLAVVEGWSVGTIARLVGVHHSTVTRVLERHAGGAKRPPRRSMIDPFVPFIREALESYPRLPASVLYRMVLNRGYPGGEDHFRHRVARLRPRRVAEAYLELRTLPGEEAQVDWASFGHYPVAGGERPLAAFVMVLSYSRMLYVRFFHDQRLGSFLEGHVRAFDFFGGVARKLLYDNLKSAVLERHGDAIRFHPTLLELAAHYHFLPRPVAVGRGNEKGRVERAIGYLRTSFFPAVAFSDLSDLNRQAHVFCADVAPRRRWPQQRDVALANAWAKEQPLLLPVPDPFPAGELVTVSAGKTPYIRFDSNRYSVPHDRVRRSLCVRATSDIVRIFDGPELVAEHPRCWDKRQVVEQPAHVAELVRQKQQARRQRGQERLLRLVPQSEQLLAEMGRRQRSLRAVVDRLGRLLDEFGVTELTAAVDEVLTTGALSAEAVRLILDRRRRARRQPPPTPVALPDRAEIRDLEVTPHNLAEYDPEALDAD